MNNSKISVDESVVANKYVKEGNYWEDKLRGSATKSTFISEDKYLSEEEFNLNTAMFKLPKDILERLLKVSNNSDQRMHMILIAAVNILLYKYTGNKDIILATPIYNQKVEAEFINTVLVIRNMVDENTTFKEFLLTVKQTMIEAVENQNYPLKKLLFNLGYDTFDNNLNLFDVVVLLENIQHKKYIKNVKANIVFSFSHDNECMKLSIDYNSSLYNNEKLESIVQHLNNVLNITLNNINEFIRNIEMISEREKNQILCQFNNNFLDIPRNKTIHELFEEQCNIIPDKIAAEDVNGKITYKELNKKANQLSKQLKRRGVKEETIVAVMVDRSIEMLICILSILKAGAAYLPVSTQAPELRKEFMFKDSNSLLLLTQKRFFTTLENIKHFNTDDYIFVDEETIYNGDSSNIPCSIGPNNLAYIIYTSGTSGGPKGVMMEHGNVINFVYGQKHTIYGKYGQNLNMCITAPYIFDASIQIIFGSLLNGHCIFIPSEDVVYDGMRLSEYYQNNSIDISDGTPTLFKILLKAIEGNEFKLPVKNFIIGGEYLSKEITRKFFYSFKGNMPVITNVYGPTEACVNATSYNITLDNIDLYPFVPIGCSIPNYNIYIVNTDLQLNPVGIIGEICIDGLGISRGYLNRQDINMTKFIDHPFKKGEKMYRTGDLGRFLNDGNIEFIGRLDNQVKLRGNRIELTEIENELLKFESIKEAIAVIKGKEDDEKYICVYIISDEEVLVNEIRKELLKYLPNYMIPTYFVKLDKMPLTPSGKVDRKALMEQEMNISIEEDYIAPSNEVEEKLVKIWSEVLNLENEVGVNSNYFELGGDSIKAIQIASKLQKYNLKVEIQDIIKYPTILELVSYVKQTTNQCDQSLIVGEVELTPIQRDFFERDLSDKHYYNNAVMLYRREGFNVDIVRIIFNKLINHHDALRITYKECDGKLRQINRGIEEVILDLEIYDLTQDLEYRKSITNIIEKLQGSMELDKGLLMKLAIFKTNDGDHLLIIVHHLLIDWVSWRILSEDMATMYEQLEIGKTLSIPLKTTSYKQWAEELKSYSNSEQLVNEIKYWNDIESIKVKPLPKDYEIVEDLAIDSETISFKLTELNTEMLLKKVPSIYNTEINDILLSALGLAIKEWTGQEKILINLEGHGREDIIDGIDITRTIGWFTSVYPFLIDMTSTDDISDVIVNTREAIRNIPNKGIGYGILKHLTPKEYIKDKKFNVKPEILFNYLGQFDNNIKTGIFELSDIAIGREVSSKADRGYKLVINSSVLYGCMEVNVEYNKRQYEKESITNFVTLFQQCLTLIINYCLNKTSDGITSDIIKSLINVDTDDANEILNQINEVLI